MQIAMIAVCMLILYRIQALVYRYHWNRNLDVFIQFKQDRVTEGETVTLEETIENRKWLPLPVVFLQFKLSKYFKIPGVKSSTSDDHYSRNELMSVMMNQRIRRKVEVVCTKRGVFDIVRASMTAKSLLLDEEYTQEIACNSSLTVYPRYVDALRFENLLKSTSGGQVVSPFTQEDPFLIRGVREYQIYDNMKSINWNATARTGDMKVNLVETVSSRQAYVFLNIQKESLAVHNEVIEESIRLAKTFCAMFSKKGMKSQLYTNGTNGEDMEAITVERGVGVSYMSKVNEALTKIFVDEVGNIVSHGREEELDFSKLYSKTMEECARDGQVVFISNSQDITVIHMLRNLHRQGLRFLWIVPVANMAEYKEEEQLKGHMRMWRLNYEGAKEKVV